LLHCYNQTKTKVEIETIVATETANTENNPIWKLS